MRPLFLVEDNPAHAELITQGARGVKANWTVLHLTTAGRAIAYLKEKGDGPAVQPELALIDLMLPDLQGTRVIEALRLRFPELPILVISSLASERSVISAIQAGADGFLAKSSSAAEIANGIRQVLEGHCPISPSLARHLFRLAHGRPSGETVLTRPLTGKEAEVLRLISQGLSYIETASSMGVALSTVQTHIRNLYRKLGVRSKLQAANRASALGLT